jgi:LmbE family N-acetylglucosaminyl deacetylase
MPRLLVVVAHPDDETFGTGSAIANAAEQGVEVTVVCATRGEMGEDTSGTTHSPEELAVVREGELRTAAKLLGAADVRVLDFADSGMDGPMPDRALAGVPIDEVADAVAREMADVDPDVVIALDPGMPEDHRDHCRIGAATTTAFERVARPDARLYYWTLPRSTMIEWQKVMRGTGVHAELAEMEYGRPDAEITTVIDVSHLCDLRWKAICEHKTQLSPFAMLSDEMRRRFLSRDSLVRAVPPWDGGPQETRIF